MKKMIAVILTAVPGLFWANSLSAESLPAHALYQAELPAAAHPDLVRRVEIATEPHAGSADLCWYRLTCTQVNGSSFTLWLLADADPFDRAHKKTVTIHRYILAEAGQKPLEYVDERNGGALLPLFNFVDELLPCGSKAGEGGLFAEGTFLGFPLHKEKDLPAMEAAVPEIVDKLVLNPDMMVGTGRNFRDDRTGRRSDGSDYNYVPFSKEDYDEMIAAGINYFLASPDQIEYIYRREIFYDCQRSEKTPPVYPQELFRGNFRGTVMFVDEPAYHLTNALPKSSTLPEAVALLHKLVVEKYDSNHRYYGRFSYRQQLLDAGIQVGSLKLAEPDIPIWETHISTTYYQFEMLPTGIFQECRWSLDTLDKINAAFGLTIPREERNLFLWDYALMRGPARVFNCRWGMSIYGQAAPEFSLDSMKLAYDMGASYFLFWTSDKLHHLPYDEQLQLARGLRDYASSHPRPPLAQLLHAATTAIVLPYGYTLDVEGLFHSGVFGLDKKNALGISYRDVLHLASREAEHCLRNKIAFDVVVAGKEFDPSDYGEVVWIKEDATVRIAENRDLSPLRYVEKKAPSP